MAAVQVSLSAYVSDNAGAVLNYESSLTDYMHLFVAPTATIACWNRITSPSLHALLFHLFKLCAVTDPDVLLRLHLATEGDTIKISIPPHDFSLDDFFTSLHQALTQRAAREAAAYCTISAQSRNRLRFGHFLPSTFQLEYNAWGDASDDSDFDDLPELIDSE
ncbi:hypothetical protein GGX14DRAFT_568680 [Mycena pura]|uniref:Uncharacterized protein n=1 Tax=Mycena pura TaxID=153505 RepID=A0AAD6VCA1_9AGAR|nr:hypothetical protein GGX14DRAFT_568680 [Mycena pura]